MVTNGSFGFISYNSREFLLHVLQDRIEEGVFARSACWYHESLGSEKNHFHCWVEPSKQIDTSSIVENFIELSEDGVQQSIAIRPRCGSKWNDAYLYGIHDSDYLSYKGLERELVNIDSDQHIYLGDFSADISQAEMYRFKVCLAPYSRIKSLVQQGKSLEEVYISLRTPFAQLASVSAAYKMLRDEFRAERVTDLASQGKSFDEVCDILDIPFNEISSVSKLYKDIKRSLNSSVGDSFIERWKK